MKLSSLKSKYCISPLLKKAGIIALLIFAAAPARAVEPAVTDSTSRAMATIVAGYLQPAFERQYPVDATARQLFTDGIAKAFAIEPADEVYYQGLAQGLNIRDNLEQMRQQGFDIDNATFLAALEKAFAGESTGFTVDSAQKYMTQVEKTMHQADAQAQTDFLAAQAVREGVQQLPSGLLFEVITEGEGESPKLEDTVEVLYTGRLANGSIFDETNGTSVKFPVNRLIPGFTEGLTMMKPGGTYRLFIPSELGYGDRGAGKDIPGGAALDFTVTLVDIVK